MTIQEGISTNRSRQALGRSLLGLVKRTDSASPVTQPKERSPRTAGFPGNGPVVEQRAVMPYLAIPQRPGPHATHERTLV